MAEFQVHRKLTGGVRLAARKRMSTATGIGRNLAPKRLIIPMTQQLGPPATPTVVAGQRVIRGQVVGEPGESPSAAVHAPRSGEVLALEQRLVPGGSGLVRSPCVLLAVDDAPTNVRPIRQGHWPDGHTERLRAIRAAGTQKCAWIVVGPC